MFYFVGYIVEKLDKGLLIEKEVWLFDEDIFFMVGFGVDIVEVCLEKICISVD